MVPHPTVHIDKLYMCIKYRHMDSYTKSYILAYMCMSKHTFALYMHVYCNECLGSHFQYHVLDGNNI